MKTIEHTGTWEIALPQDEREGDTLYIREDIHKAAVVEALERARLEVMADLNRYTDEWCPKNLVVRRKVARNLQAIAEGRFDRLIAEARGKA